MQNKYVNQDVGRVCVTLVDHVACTWSPSRASPQHGNVMSWKPFPHHLLIVEELAPIIQSVGVFLTSSGAADDRGRLNADVSRVYNEACVNERSCI